jgi:hypothetical protein
MSLSNDLYYGESDEYIEDDEPSVKAEPFPVRIVSEDSANTTRVAPDYGACMTWPIPQAGIGLPVQVLTRRIRRSKARLIVPGNVVTATLTPGNPAAGASFIYTNSTNVPQSMASIQATLTTSAAVLNRFISATIKDASGNVLYRAINGSATPASSAITWNGFIGANQQNSATGTFTFGLPALSTIPIPSGGTLTLGAGALDAADQITAIVLELTQTTTILINSKPDPLTLSVPQGVTLPNSFEIDWESQQPCYAISLGGSASLSVIDESYSGG